MTDTIVTPYVFFAGNCEEAVSFYQQHLGAELLGMMRFSDSPEPLPSEMVQPGFESRILHAELRIGTSRLMLSDGASDQETFRGFSLAISAPDEATVHRYFNALANGGEVQMPVAKTFWSPCYGMVKDRFGLLWMVMVESSEMG